MDTQVYDQAVQRGMALLDEHFGREDWIEQIDVDELLMSNASKCILGQLFNVRSNSGKLLNQGYYQFYKGKVVDEPDPTHHAAKYGFYLPFDGESYIGSHEDWQCLRKSWETAIEKRRAELGMMV